MLSRRQWLLSVASSCLLMSTVVQAEALPADFQAKADKGIQVLKQLAGEVRSLAQKSASAAQDIRGLINNTLIQVTKGTELSAQSGEALSKIEQSIFSVGQLVSRVTDQSAQQQNMIVGVNADIAQFESTTQQNAALVEEIAAATSRMQEQTEQLLHMMMQFKLPNQSQRLLR